jgi:transposase-like protein
MAHYAPGSQSRSIMAEKEQIARRLLSQGLSVTQICGQLRCSPYFVRRARAKAALGSSPEASRTFFDHGRIAVEQVRQSGDAWI